MKNWTKNFYQEAMTFNFKERTKTISGIRKIIEEKIHEVLEPLKNLEGICIKHGENFISFGNIEIEFEEKVIRHAPREEVLYIYKKSISGANPKYTINLDKKTVIDLNKTFPVELNESNIDLLIKELVFDAFK